MAKLPASSQKVWLDEFALATDLTAAGLDVTQEIPTVTTLGDAGPRRLVGNYDFAMPYLGLFDFTDDAYDEQIHLLLESAADHYATIALGSAIGDVAYDGVCSLVSQPREASLGGAVALNFDLAGRESLSRGVLLGNKTTTGAEDLTGVNQGATVANQTYRAIFRIISFTGTNITLTIEESQNDGGGDAYGAIAGLNSGAQTGVGVWEAETTSATEAWKRLAVSGTFTSVVIVVSAGVLAGE